MNDIIPNILGTITLPLIILLALGTMFGAKPDSIIKPFFDLLIAIITGITKLTFNLIRLAYQQRKDFSPPPRRPQYQTGSTNPKGPKTYL